MRVVHRIFGVSRPTLANWLEKIRNNPQPEETLLPAQADDDLELDEMWSFELKMSDKHRLWTVLCRRTRKTIAHVIGDRSMKTCRKL
jgi:hypothetical protein